MGLLWGCLLLVGLLLLHYSKSVLNIYASGPAPGPGERVVKKDSDHPYSQKAYIIILKGTLCTHPKASKSLSEIIRHHMVITIYWRGAGGCFRLGGQGRRWHKAETWKTRRNQPLEAEHSREWTFQAKEQFVLKFVSRGTGNPKELPNIENLAQWSHW